MLFDGVCNFCDDAVNFVIRHDQTGRFKFAPLQSEIGLDLRKRHGIPDAMDSLVVVENDRAYTHSTGALRIARGLGGAWRLLYAFIIVPRPVRDLLYKLFARYRYRMFGRKDACMMPTPEIRERFLD